MRENVAVAALPVLTILASIPMSGILGAGKQPTKFALFINLKIAKTLGRAVLQKLAGTRFRRCQPPSPNSSG